MMTNGRMSGLRNRYRCEFLAGCDSRMKGCSWLNLLR